MSDNDQSPYTFIRPSVTGSVFAIVVCAFAFGCGSVSTRFVSGLSAEQRAMAAKLPIYREELPQASYEEVGPVEGFSCQITRDDSYEVSEANALKELQRATVKAGGDAVMTVSCEQLNRGRSSRRCFRSVVCRGIAIKTGPARITRADSTQRALPPSSRPSHAASEGRTTSTSTPTGTFQAVSEL